jgi:hypothetical protein
VSYVHIFQACQELFLSGSFVIGFGVTTRIISSVVHVGGSFALACISFVEVLVAE